MELINNTFIPEKEIPRSRRAAGRKAFLQTFRNLFTSRNHFRRFMDTYRFNTIRWSASNLHEPSWGKRIGLFFRTKNPIAILRDDYRSNRSNLLNKWETSSLNRIQMELVRMGSMPIQNKDRHTFKALNSIEKKIKQLQEYEGCPDMSHEKQLLATYKYILSSPFDRKFGGLPPDEICGMLQQNGLSESNLPYQNYEGILQGRETVMYELATGKNGEKYPTGRSGETECGNVRNLNGFNQSFSGKGNTPAESDGKHTSIGKEREALHSQRTEEKGTERKIKGQECKN